MTHDEQPGQNHVWRRMPLLICGNKAGLVQKSMMYLLLYSKVHAILGVGSRNHRIIE